MNVILFDPPSGNRLLPFTLTRPVADIRIGILTIREKWERLLQCHTSSITRDYLREKFPMVIAEDNLLISGSVLPDRPLAERLLRLDSGEALFDSEGLLAVRLNRNDLLQFPQLEHVEKIKCAYVAKLQHNWDIFQKNDTELRKDFDLVTANRKSMPLSPTNQLIGPESALFIEEGAVVEGAILNCQTGPIYIAAEAEVMEGTMIRGPFSLGEHSQIKMGAKIYGPTTIGPYCKVGGELNNVVFFGYSNKAHDGFMGNSVVGEWCNFGADTNTSNLKNNYGEIKVIDYETGISVNSGTQFCGLFMGDHSKCGINSMFNSGTMVGVGCNMFGTGYIRGLVPSFSYGGPQEGFEVYRLDKAIETATRVYERRGKIFDKMEESIMTAIFRQSHPSLFSEKE